jgi:hypothetical protein
LSLISGFWHSAEAQEIRFQKHVLTQEFYAEGAAASDFDGDGVGDVVAGPWIYWGPSYQEKTAIYEPKAYSVNGYSDMAMGIGMSFSSVFRGHRVGGKETQVLGKPEKDLGNALRPFPRSITNLPFGATSRATANRN